MTSEPTLRSHYPLSGLRVIEIAEGVAGPTVRGSLPTAEPMS